MKIKINNILKIKLIILLFIIYILYYYIEDTVNLNNNFNFVNDGIFILYDTIYNSSNKTINEKLKIDVLNKLPKDYEFIDYSYIIKNTSLSHFHRDVTSSQTIYKSKYPIYTLIVYKSNGTLLSVCPGSHLTYPFVNSRIVNIEGTSGTAILFNCDILHSGCKNLCKKKEIIQYKMCHKSDLHLLKHLIGKHVKKEEKCSISIMDTITKKLSYYFQLPINTIFVPFMIERKNDNTFIGQIQKYLPISFYNNI
jgi:hypothetical protein